jgi:hypothetical protein
VKAERPARWVVVDTGNFQYTYVGKTDLDDYELNQVMDSGGVLDLHEARTMRCVGLPTMQGTIIQRVSIIPIGWLRGAIPTIKVIPAALWIPDQEDSVFVRLMEECEKSEALNRAKDAGIEPAGPGDMPKGPRPS